MYLVFALFRISWYKNKSLSLAGQSANPEELVGTMKIKMLAIGKTDDKSLQALIGKYERRLKHYIGFDMEVIPDVKKAKSLSAEEQKRLEGEAILKKVQPGDLLVLLDERGKEFRSLGFAQYLQKKMNAGTRSLFLVIGGPYGFSEPVYSRADEQISLSKMTFSHQMIRLFLVEQIYRAFTILRNEPYHHE
jgi:23S rRNA (pseudouridine1915-N3)-methyltransferase